VKWLIYVDRDGFLNDTQKWLTPPKTVAFTAKWRRVLIVQSRIGGCRAAMQTIPKIFLSYASEDHPWVENFVEVFSEYIGGVKIQDFKAGDNLEFGELQKWVDDTVSEATGVIAFVSEYYQSKEWTLAEWKKTVNEYRRRRLVFVPIMLDAEAKGWWANLRTQGDLCELPVDYMYCN
jgi:hypothetical protein